MFVDRSTVKERGEETPCRFQGLMQETEGITIGKMGRILDQRSAVGSRHAKQQRCDLLKKTTP